MSALLDIQHLKVHFRKNEQIIQAVRGISFQLLGGERLGIVGESGCGKSVTARALIKLMTPATYTEGHVYYEGQDLLTFSESQLRAIRGKEIGFIFQDPGGALNPTMTIGKQIAEGYLLHHPHISTSEARAYTIDLLHLVGIQNPQERIDSYPHQLSGGQRQRVMIACAIAPQPKILIADEPTTALDVTIQAQILDLLKDIQKKRAMSIIFITHDMHVAASFCDRILVMYAGKIVESAPSERLFKSPQHPYTQGLLAAIPGAKGKQLQPIVGAPPLLSNPPTGCAFYPRCAHAMVACKALPPPDFACAENQLAACWLNDPRAKK